MALPVRATSEDIDHTCAYLATKPTGATLNDIRGVLGEKLADGRRIAALKSWGLVDEPEEGRYKATEEGRLCSKGEAARAEAMQRTIKNIPAYLAVIERAAHRKEDSLSTTDVASHWHDHFKDQVGDSEDSIKAQAVCFFQVAQCAGLGTIVIGRRGALTRLSFSVPALAAFVGRPAQTGTEPAEKMPENEQEPPKEASVTEKPVPRPPAEAPRTSPSGRGIFVAHGKNKAALDQLKKILDQFKIVYKVAIDEPMLGRPISGKIRDIMESCNCAILIFTADEEFKDKNGNTIWRPSENVVYELGASGYLYDNRIVIMKEDGVTFPSNFSDLGYISFEKDQLGAKAMDVLKELIGFGIVKVST